MSRLLIILAVFLLVYWILRSYSRRTDHKGEKGRKDAGAGENMVRCVHCGVYLPKSESILAGGEFFCSDEHRRLHLK